MFLPELCIRRPVLATVLSLVIVLLGLIAFDRLSVREYPKIDTPVVSVRTVYKGAGAQVVESQITQPLEDALSGIEGIRTIKSISREEVSTISIEFTLARDTDAAANDVRDRVARARGRLPDAADDSVVAKVEADAQAIMWLAFSSENRSALEITDYADRNVADLLKTLPGVSSVIIGGERRFAMRIWLDRDRLAGYGLTAAEVEAALRRQNVELPAGRIESRQREFTVLAESDLRTVQQFNDMIIADLRGYPVRLRDVGRAELGALDERNVVRVNGKPAVGLGIVKQSTANTLSVARAVKAVIPRIEQALPAGMKLSVAFDSSVFIEASITSVYRTLAEALILVVLVIFLFLRSVRATLIPFVTIPVSLIGACFVVYLMGFTINVLTLLGIVLAVGLVVDDAIVVLENIHRHIEDGETPFRAAVIGSREIAFAVVAMTVTLAAVFAPLAFSTGNTGKLFAEFALTVAAAVLVSGFVALTLTPMMCSRLLRHEARHGALFNASERAFAAVNAGYRSSLRVLLRHRWVVILLFAGGLVLAGHTYRGLKEELAPLEDRGFFIGIIVAPDGASLGYTDQYARMIEGFLGDIPEIRSFFMAIAPGLEKPNPVNTAITFVRLVPWEERTRSQVDVVKSIAPKLFSLPGVLAFPINPPSLGQSFRNPPVQFVVQANTYEELDRLTDALMAKARQFPGLANVDSDLKLNKPQIAVDLDRDRISTVGADVDAIGRTLETMLGGRQVTRFKLEGKQYDVVVQMEEKDRAKPADLAAIYVRGRDGGLVQLSNLVKLRETVAPKELNHFNRQRAAIISANIAPGYTLGEALAFLDDAAREVVGPAGKTELDGQSREFRESGAQLLMLFLLALVFIYLVLSAQFESFVGPFVIMLTVPLGVMGALLALSWTGGTLNVYSKAGLIMLIGLVTKNGILIVEFANQLCERGLDRLDAVVEGSVLRLRPILMTSLATVLGAVPLARATGAGAESRTPIGWVIVGGVLLGTVLTLFVIPVAYSLLVRGRPRREAPGVVDHGQERDAPRTAAAPADATATVRARP
jgi:multidrug efflux pump